MRAYKSDFELIDADHLANVLILVLCGVNGRAIVIRDLRKGTKKLITEYLQIMNICRL